MSRSTGIPSRQLEKTFDRKDFMHTYLTDGKLNNFGKRYKAVVDACMNRLYKWQGARQEMETIWEESWAHYLSNYRGNTIIERNTILTNGDVQSDFRHKIPTSKAYELVESCNAYLQGAFFPSKQWFYMTPKMPIQEQDWETQIDILNKYVLKKLEDAHFKTAWDRFIRQLLVTGTSVLALPWLYDTRETYKNEYNKKSGKWEKTPITKIIKNGFKFDVVDMFDFYLDPSKPCLEDSAVIRRVIMPKGEVIRLIQSGHYPLGDTEVIKTLPQYSKSGTISEEKKEVQKWMNGLGRGEYRAEDDISVYEYYGDLIIDGCEYLDVHVVFCENCLLVFEPNQFWGGMPFVIGTLVPGHETPYGKGLLDPVQGQLHQLYLSQNHRLDCDELVIDPMWLVVNDGSVNLEDFYSEPGRIIPVEDVDTAARQLEFSAQNLGVTLQDEGLLETRIDQATGLGDYINTQGRDAERVTAEEVRTRQQAGGNRLTRYHKHIEESALGRLLELSYAYLQQFVVEDEVVRLQKPNTHSMSDEYDFYAVGQNELTHDMELTPVGADHVVDKETALRERIDFYTFIQNLPQAAQFINWKEVVKDLARRLVKEDWTKFVVLPEEQGAVPIDAGTGKSHLDMMNEAMQAQGAPQGQQMPPEGMPPQEQVPQMPEQSFDQQQVEQLLRSSPQAAQGAVDKNVQPGV